MRDLVPLLARARALLPTDWQLVSDLQLQLVNVNNRDLRLALDFNSKLNQHRQRSLGKNQPLAKAVKIKDRLAGLKVVDATAGLGRDAWCLAALGAQVDMIESSPIICALLEDALQRARELPHLASISQRLTLTCADSRHKLASWPECDCILLDPMFSDNHKQSAPKQGMQVLQQLLGQQQAEPLLESALQANCRKVVLKRHARSVVLQADKRTYEVVTKTGRFDVYWRGG